jgi:hypothetical protein
MSCYHLATLSALFFLVVGIDHVKTSQQVTEKIVEADRQVTRLPPSAFLQVPTEIRRELKRRGCTIPQVSSSKELQNVIKGEFIGKGRADWAVLCSLNGISRILIFTNASEREPLEIASRADAGSLQSGRGTAIEYSRAIEAVDREYILKHRRAYDGPEPPAIDHQGISDSFEGKASVVHYFYAGKWLELTGAD